MATAYPDPDEDGQSDSETLSTTCLVCEDGYTEPKILPCAHRLCRKCLVTWLTSSKAAPSCPLCQQTIKEKSTKQLAVSASDQPANSSVDAIVDDLPTDIVLAALVSCTKKLRPPVFCDVCDRRETAQDFCLECGDRFCSGCLKCHSAMGATRNHEVKKISTLTPRDLAFSRRERCSVHPDQYLDVYCPSHGQPLCFKCCLVDHKNCKPAETIEDAAKRQRGIVQAQVDKLNQTIADVKRDQYVYTESVKKCSTDLAALISRLNEALKGREKQLQAQIASTQMPLKQDLQRHGKELEEWKTLAASNKVLVTEMMMSASDVSLLRVSGSLAARAARLTADVTRSLAETRNQRLVLDFDQYDVLRVEELLRDLGTVELTEQKQTQGPVSFLPPTKDRSKGGADTCVNPFDADFRDVGQVRIDGLHFREGNTICAAQKDTLIVSDDESVFYMRTFQPYENGRIITLKCKIRDTSNLEEGLVAVVTDTKLLYLINVTKQPMGVAEVFLSGVYVACAPGLQDTLLLSPEAENCTLDVINRDGRRLQTIACGCLPSKMFRMKDYVLLASRDCKYIRKVHLKGNITVEIQECPRYPEGLFVDHLDNLYVLDNYTQVLFMRPQGEWNEKHIVNWGGIVVTKDGKAFTLHCSAGEPVPVVVHTLAKH